MTRERTQLRKNEVESRNINEVLIGLYRRIEALEKTRFIEVTVTTDAAANMSPVSVAAPEWPVKAVYLARAYNKTAGTPFSPARIGWESTKGALTVALWTGDVAVSTTYQLTLEVRG
jgi:hypothetical protein